MMQIALVLLTTATISYWLLPMIKPLAYWQSTGIFFCLLIAYLAATIQRRAAVDPLLDRVRTAVNSRSRPASKPAQMPPTVTPTMRGTAPRFAPPIVPLPEGTPRPKGTRPVTQKAPKPEGPLQAEANAINRLLRGTYGLNCMIKYWKRGSIMEAPDFIGYLLDEARYKLEERARASIRRKISATRSAWERNGWELVEESHDAEGQLETFKIVGVPPYRDWVAVTLRISKEIKANIEETARDRSVSEAKVINDALAYYFTP